jgi:hypothetical protein
MNQTDLAARLDQLEARNAISEVIYRYAHCVRTGDMGIVDLFTKDATFTVMQLVGRGEPTRMSHISTPAEFEKFYANVTSHGDRAPLVHNLIIDVQGDRANSYCMMSGARYDGSAQFLGYYNDTFRREDKWRFTSRVYTVYAVEGQGAG